MADATLSKVNQESIAHGQVYAGIPEKGWYTIAYKGTGQWLTRPWSWHWADRACAVVTKPRTQYILAAGGPPRGQVPCKLCVGAAHAALAKAQTS